MLRFLTAGESHGPYLTAIVEGLPAGLPLAAADLDDDLTRRQRGFGSGGRMKIEKDTASLSSGLAKGLTTGAPLAIRIENKDWKNWQDKAVEPMTIPRPGHADLTGALKYGYDDLRLSLERASARETAARVAVGAVMRKLINELGMRVGSYVTAIGNVQADLSAMPYAERLDHAEDNDVRCPDPTAAEQMRQRIWDTMQARDTIGGVFEVVALGVPPGLGSHVHWDRKLDGRLAQAVMSIHAIKGVEIGEAFANAALPGTQAHDEIFVQDGRLVRRSNRAGGLEGGITTGEALLIRAAMKPIATTLTPLNSVDLASGAQVKTKYERSDFCAVPRAGVVGEAMVCCVLAEALAEKLGGDTLVEMQERLARLRQNRLDDLQMDNQTWRMMY